MKKIVTLMIATMFSTSLFAQIALLNYDVQEAPYEIYENGAVIDVNGMPSSYTLEAHLGVLNQGTETANIILRRTDLNVMEGTSNYFCWGLCFPSNVSISQPVLMEPNVADFYGFSAHYEMRDEDFNFLPLPLGISSVCYSFFDERTPDDSVWVIVRYVVSETDVEEMSNVSSKVYPNPAVNQLFVETETVENGTIAIYNMVGQKVKEVAANSEKTAIDLSDLQSGVYFYSIFSNGVKVDSKRFVVAK